MVKLDVGYLYSVALLLLPSHAAEPQAWMGLRAAEAHLEDGTAYRPKRVHEEPNHISRIIASIIKIGPHVSHLRVLYP